MHGWTSNSSSVLKDIEIKSNSLSLIKSTSNIHGEENVLGLKWLNEIDKLSFNVNNAKLSNEIYEGLKRPTKREFLAVIMSIFDPLGFLTPFTIRSKILMREIWNSAFGWDEQLRDKEFVIWKLWLSDLKGIAKCRVERCYQLKENQTKSAELHIFNDASSRAYTVVAYWRFSINENYHHVSIIMAKSRVAPLKIVTIPGLELQAAVLAVRLASLIEKEHRFIITKRVFWCDSKPVLCWINRDPREFKIFGANRVTEVRENTKPSEWR